MKTVKRILLSIGIAIIALIAGVILFVNLAPQFGAASKGERLATIQLAPNYSDGKFINSVPTESGLKKEHSPWKVFREVFFTQKPNMEPDWQVPRQKIDSTEVSNLEDSITRLTWFGHSAFLLEIDGLKVLIDPMLSEVPAPVSFVGPKRFYEDLPLEPSRLPRIDVVIFSHDHYDHLDYGTVKKIKDRVDHFFVPLGLGAHLERWGVSSEQISELNWWQKAQHKGLTLVSTPARHFSGRGLTDQNKTLWSSWVIKGSNENIFFSGDGGYFDGFSEIGEKYGPFDFAMMECGQYNEMWSDIHMMPEETAQAAVDLKAKMMMPIHWGSFKLALHTWTDPIERVSQKAKELGMPMSTPQIGQPVIIGSEYPNEKWWVRENIAVR